MLKRIMPPLLLVLSVLLDTAAIPLFYAGRFLIPLSLVMVILIGIQLGRVRGMVFGLIGGLLLDISAGTTGMKLFPYVLIGFLIGFLLDQQPEISRGMETRERIQILAVRLIWVSVLVALHEAVMLVIQYFSTAVFDWEYVWNLLARTLITTALVEALYPLTHRLFIGRKRSAASGRATREVKRF